MVDEHDALAPRIQQVEAGERTDDVLVLVEDGIAAVTALHEHFLHVVKIVAEMEADDVVCGFAYTVYRDGLKYKARSLTRIERGGDDAGGGCALGKLGTYIRLTDDEAVDAVRKRGGDDLRLIAADKYCVLTEQRGVFKRLRKRDDDAAGDGVDKIAAFVDDAPLKHAQQIKDRKLVYPAAVYGLHIIGRDVSGGEHAVERAVVVDDGHGGDLPLAHGAPRQIHRHGAVQLRRAVKVQVADLCAHALYILRRFKAEMVEHVLRFIVYRADAHGLVFPVPERVAELCV